MKEDLPSNPKRGNFCSVYNNKYFVYIKNFCIFTENLVYKQNNSKIDFVCERGGEKLYVQVTYILQDEKTIDREFGNLLRINDNYPKIVVSMDEFTGNTYEGIRHLPIRKFLTEWK